MAKWGEGDPRWIVEERSDATNVNNWHWVEKNATPWSQQRLRELLLNQTLSKGSFKVEFTEFKKLEGEATANNRKAKLIFFFEWNIIIDFKATISGDDVQYTGTVEVLNLSDENEANEIEISTTVTNRGPHENELLKMLNTDGLQFVRQQLGLYIYGLKKEFSQGLILPTDKAGAIKPQAGMTKGKTVVDKREFQNDVVMFKNNTTSDTPKAQAAAETGKVGVTGGFELSEMFKVPPERLYDILTEPELISAWCPNSNVEAREGGTFSLLGGGIITGAFTELVKNKKISMKWRLKSYPPGHYADVQLELRDLGDSVDLQLKAERVPENLMEDTKTGFSKYYFLGIGRKFGISLNMF